MIIICIKASHILINQSMGHNFTEKELPQEQPWSAWGFFSTWKVERISSWLKSTVAPFTNSRLSWSTTTPTPPASKTLRAESRFRGGLVHSKKTHHHQGENHPKAYLSSSFLLRSTENLYWNPEQPPPSTCILRYSPFSMISDSLWIKKHLQTSLYTFTNRLWLNDNTGLSLLNYSPIRLLKIFWQLTF